MRLKKFLIFQVLISLLTMPEKSTAQDYNDIFYECYISSDMAPWKETIEKMEQQLDEDDYNQLFDITLACYGYIGYCLGNNKKDEAGVYLNNGWKYLKKLTQHSRADAAPFALKSGFYGFEMALSRYKAIYLGPKSMSALEQAAAIDSTDIHYHIEKGNQMYYLPSLLGGDKEVAIYHYKKAIEIMEAGSRYHKRHWFYLNSLVTLGYSYEVTGHINEARTIYQKIHSLEPHFKWFNEEVWPDFVKKHGAD
ncbi:hypothetical protein [Thermophagus xiamenensis]|uniref:Tetratricopeptide repeat-containing protein n=1 Tax=Thermophagus xiamenensis TaxID=385682 RepID=A0A1I1W093_9BACT|nr:hypothetical protein [Thermophagus xiamenensis]SFD86733.1 hypothetical protein SAMN05444380_10379 [Thermophagus xiamenensis]